MFLYGSKVITLQREKLIIIQILFLELLIGRACLLTVCEIAQMNSSCYGVIILKLVKVNSFKF